MARDVDVVNKSREGVPETVLEQIHAVMHLYRARQYQALRDAPEAVTHMESKALGFFARRPGATQAELVAHSGRDKGQLARLVAALRERGLLETRPDENDRRNVRLYVTEAGRAADQAVRRQARRLAAVAVRGFSEEERQQLAGLVERVRANLADDAEP
jgi:DNA-binding MarR family transcriptional regulator